jgi:hypothetical protein
MFDLECQSHACPRRLYIHPLKVYVDFGERCSPDGDDEPEAAKDRKGERE